MAQFSVIRLAAPLAWLSLVGHLVESPPVDGATIRVPDDASTIQGAIDAATHGDVVLVADGVYTGPGNRSLDPGGKRIQIRSENGRFQCTIDCAGTGRGFNIHSAETAETIISGFAIIGGKVEDGAGILCRGASPTIEKCVIQGCEASPGEYPKGGGLYLENASPTVSDCSIVYNSAGYYGGGAYLQGGAPVFINCNFFRNESGNYAGGIACAYSSSPTFVHCSIYGNEATATGGVRCTYDSSPTFANCILYGNSGLTGGAQLSLNSGSATAVTHCDVEGGIGALYVEPGCTVDWGAGNIDANPVARYHSGMLRLLRDSPCIDAGMDAGILLDAEGEARPYNLGGVDNNGPGPEIDIGADEFRHCSGGDIVVPDDEYYLFRAVRDAREGDEICVRDGRHIVGVETGIDFAGKRITLRSQHGAANCVVDCQDGKGFVFQSGEDWTSKLIGFTVINGWSDHGAAVRCTNGSSPLLSRCALKHNRVSQRGGAVAADASSPQIQYTEIRDNLAFDRGGGVWVSGGSPRLTSCDIGENTGVQGGGGLAWSQGQGALLACRIADNRTSQNLADEGRGGGLWLMGSSPTIEATEFRGNRALHAGAAICAQGGSLPLVERCRVVENYSSGSGGGLYLDGGAGSVASTLVAGNFSLGHAGGIACVSGAAPTFANCTVVENRARANGGGIWSSNAAPIFRNSILWGNTAFRGPQVALTDTATLGLSTSDCEGGDLDLWMEVGCAVDWGGGNLEDNPFFLESGSWDAVTTTWTEGDYHLSSHSPCIDTGVNVGVYFDLDDTVRPQGSGFDIGAYEYVTTAAAFLRGDPNQDGEIDISDPIVTLGFEFAGRPETLDCEKAADVDDNGDVELTDAIYSLEYQYLGGPSPRAPFPLVGLDRTPDELPCESYEPER